MISDHSDNSTVPSEVDSTPEDDFSSFEIMEEDCDFSLDPAFKDPTPDALPAPKVTPKVWEADSIISVGDLQDPLKSSVPARSKPFDYGRNRTPEEADYVPSVAVTVSKMPVGHQSHSS